MCGIVGIVSERGDAMDGRLKKMTDTLIHRGPDAEGFAHLGDCQLGHRRLSIIDLVTGEQPMSDVSGRYWITFNGEIYNFRELRQRFEKMGIVFTTTSDTEVLIQTYIQYSEKAPEHLIGQFAFAIWDSQEKTLFAARDRLGEKPFYWCFDSHRDFLFASEIKALIAAGGLAPQIDPDAVYLYLALIYLPPDRTIYQNIYTLPPGSAMVWKNAEIRQWKYWQPHISAGEKIDRNDAVHQIRNLLRQAVTRQMVADVPVGAFLSGGLDSSTIVGLMTQNSANRIKTFSVGFGSLINELPYARVVADRYNTEHYEIQANFSVLEMLHNMVTIYDEPFGDSSNIPTYLISKFASAHVKVALSGDGGDELFGGYDWYKVFEPGPTFARFIPAQVYRLILQFARIGSRTGTVHPRVVQWYLMQYLKSRSAVYESVPWERHLSVSTYLFHSWNQYLDHFPRESSLRSLREAFEPASDMVGVDRAVDFDVRCYLPGDILAKVDRAAMANGLETRAPFLDVDLVEFVLGLPSRLRFHNQSAKLLMREACGDLWPAEIHNRPKQGFGSPLDVWLGLPEVKNLVSHILRKDSPLRSLLHIKPSGQIGTQNRQQMWSLLCLGLWLEQHTACLTSL